MNKGGVKKAKAAAYGSAQRMGGQAMALVAFIAFTAVAIGWMFNDITGEYSGFDNRVGQIHMSIIRKATTVRSELSYGYGPILECTNPYVNGDKITWKFQVARKWQRESVPAAVPGDGWSRRQGMPAAQQNRIVSFTGEINNGVVSGVLQDGMLVMPVTLNRDALASIYRQIQSHMPWIS